LIQNKMKRDRSPKDEVGSPRKKQKFEKSLCEDKRKKSIFRKEREEKIKQYERDYYKEDDYYHKPRYNKRRRYRTYSKYRDNYYRRQKTEEEIQYELRRHNPKDPHLGQAKEIIKFEGEFTLKQRILDVENAPREAYRRRRGELKTVNHWGQRKLLMSEIEFLSLYCTEESVVIYAGAAPGTHIAFLSDLFPMCKFILVDPAKFTVLSTSKIEIHQTFFTDAFAEELAEKYKKCLFISDIRTACWKVMSEKEIEEQVKKDMEAQQRWVKILKPQHSMLKFRLPYCTKDRQITEYEYLDGDVFLPVWGPQTTTETRLIVHGWEKMKIWNPLVYEQQMFYFNTKTRVFYYEHDFGLYESEGLDHCFDCRSEIFILTEYLNKFQPTLKGDDLKREIIRMSKEISRQLSSTRTLHYISVVPQDGMQVEDIERERERAKKLLSVSTEKNDKK